MGVIKTFEFSKEGFEKMKEYQYGLDWPVVYFVENERDAYIGQTTRLYHRSCEHYKNLERRKLHSIHIMTDEEYNISAAFDVESWLIQYVAADGKFKLQNGNGGLKNHQYFDREKYKAKFEQIIWPELQKRKLVKQDLVQLKNSDLFKYSPYKALTEDQVAVVEALVGEIAGEKLSFLVHGRPGTGKTIIAVYLMKYLLQDERTSHLKVGLVVPMTSLRKTLKKVFKNVVGLSPSMVIGPSEVMGKKYDLLLVDEAHRLRRRKNITNYQSFDQMNQSLGLSNEGTELDWIMRASSKRVFFYDEQQSVRPSDIEPEALKKLNAKEFTLKSQHRVQGGEEYLAFVDAIFDRKTLSKVRFSNYDFKIYTDISSMVTDIKKLDSKVGLARLVAGYAWPWVTKKDSNENEGFDIEIENIKLRWNSTNSDWVNSKNAINEVGCIHTVQGYDLNYVGVIIGPELQWKNGKFIFDRTNYFDSNGHRGVHSDEEVLGYITNIYKTLMTRGILGTYLYVTDPGLREHLKSMLN